MAHLPQKCFYRAQQVRELDQRAIAAGISGFTLMQRAGTAACRNLRMLYPRARRITVVCGAGNNGGDGYIVAAEALKGGLEVRLLQVSGPASEVARQAADSWEQAGGVSTAFDPAGLADSDLIVDALLGTGLGRPVRDAYEQAVRAINDHPAPVIALDIPSGLHADTGAIMGIAVRAELTLTFIARKTGLYTGAGREVSGRILFDSLDAPDFIYADMPADACETSVRQCQSWLPRRAADAHKGSSGSLLVVGGDLSMSGAVGLAGRTAYATGTGLVRVATRPENICQVTGMQPELLVDGVAQASELLTIIGKVNAQLLGPGLGTSAWSRALFETCLEHGNVAVLDADGLNLLAEEPVRRVHWILTPHPGEAARLLGTAVVDIQRDRVGAAKEIVAHYGGVCVLKGSGTIVAAEGSIPRLCTGGGPALATAGSGDVLAGLIASLIVQGMQPWYAAVAGVTLHARAGEVTAAAGMFASELVNPIRELRNLVRT
jgi:NAD(P)H-hydrate epimerase